MKKIPVEEAVGHVLCHDMTRIVKGEMKGPQFRKGHIIKTEDVPMLRSMGKEQIYVWEKPPDSFHEDEAAEALAMICRGTGISQKEPSEGKIELFAERDGLFEYDTAILDRINEIEGLIITARHNHSAVRTGDKLAAMKVVPLVIEENKLRQAKDIAGQIPLMRVLPYRLKRAAIITTGSEIAQGLITDTFTPVLREKLSVYGIKVIKHIIVSDDTEKAAGPLPKPAWNSRI
jgi:molybdopterin biosynthesis enzyme